MTDTINILYLYSAKGFGGIVRNLSLLTQGLSTERFGVSVISLANPGDVDSDLPLADGSGITFRRIDERRALDLGAVREIHRYILDNKIDVVSCHGYKADVYGFLLRFFLRTPCVMVTMVHGWTRSGRKVGFYVWLDMLVMRFFDAIVLVSAGQRDRLRRFLIPGKKMTVIHNAIDVSDIRPVLNDKTLRKALTVGGRDTVIGLVGRLGKEKDVLTAIRSFRRVRDRYRDVKLLIVGDGPERAALEQGARDAGMAGQVIFTGYRKDVERIYGVMDIFLSTSLGEGLSNSLLEAQARRIPCVVSDVPGNREVVSDGTNGFLVAAGDAAGFADRIIALMDSPPLRERIGRGAERVMRDRFSLRERIGRLEALYRSVCEGVR